MTSVSPEQELSKLLCSLFDANQLRQFVEQSHAGEQLRSSLPGPAAALKDVAHVVVTEGRRRHLLGPQFFDALVAEFPGRTTDIQAVRTRFAAISQTPPSVSTPLPWRRVALVVAGLAGCVAATLLLQQIFCVPDGGSRSGTVLPARPPIRDAIDLRNGHIYFFKNDTYARFNKLANHLDRPYRVIREFWDGWPAEFDAVDAAVRADLKNDRGGRDAVAYFFRRDRFIIFDIARDRVAHQPAPIREHCKGWPEDWTSVDAALNLETGDHRLYLFRGDQVVSIDDDGQTDAPRPIRERFPGVFPEGIEAAFAPGDGKAYFFRGDEYLSFDIATNTVDSPAPGKPSERWSGLTF